MALTGFLEEKKERPFRAEKKFWEIPELVERLLDFLDLPSTLHLAQIHELTRKILQGSLAWNKLIKRCVLLSGESDAPLEDKMVVVKDLTALLMLMKVPKANMMDLLDLICEKRISDLEILLGNLPTVQMVSSTHPDPWGVTFSDFLLLEVIEGAFGTAEQKVEKVNFSGETLKEPFLSALSSRISRQQKKLPPLAFSNGGSCKLLVESKKSAEAFQTLMEASSEIDWVWETIEVAKPIGAEGWKMLAEGLRLHPDMALGRVRVLKEDLQDDIREDIRVIYDALMPAGKLYVHVELDPNSKERHCHRFEKVRKTDGDLAWTRLDQIMGMSTQDWTAQFVDFKVLNLDSKTEWYIGMKQTTKMKKLKEFLSNRIGESVNNLQFLLGGRQINDDDTPGTLEMDVADVIEVSKKETGIHCASF